MRRMVGSLGLGAEDGRFADLGGCLGFGAEDRGFSGLGAEDGRFSGFGGLVLGKKWGGWVWGNKVEGVSIG